VHVGEKYFTLLLHNIYAVLREKGRREERGREREGKTEKEGEIRGERECDPASNGAMTISMMTLSIEGLGIITYLMTPSIMGLILTLSTIHNAHTCN